MSDNNGFEDFGRIVMQAAPAVALFGVVLAVGWLISVVWPWLLAGAIVLGIVSAMRRSR